MRLGAENSAKPAASSAFTAAPAAATAARKGSRFRMLFSCGANSEMFLCGHLSWSFVHCLYRRPYSS